jgi:hypothetical protein
MNIKDQKTILLVEDDVVTAMAGLLLDTALGKRGAAGRSLTGGGTEHLSKPIKKGILPETIQKYRTRDYNDMDNGDQK